MPDAPREIERRFAVSPGDLVALLKTKPSVETWRIQQCYLSSTGEWAIRARLAVKVTAPDQTVLYTLTMKKRVDHGEAIEIEIPLQMTNYVEILNLCGKDLRKTRYRVIDDHGQVWEVDNFDDGLLDFCIAEIELPSIDTPIIIPDWVGREITGEDEYSNRSLYGRL